MAHLIASVDEALAKLAGTIGFPLDQVRYVMCMLVMIFAAIPYRLLPGAALKHIFSVPLRRSRSLMRQIVLSISACIFCLGAFSWLHSFGTASVVYLLMALFPKQCHILTFVFCFVYMSGSHIYRQYTDYMGWSMDFTGPQMVITLKLVSLAFCYHDGLPGSGELTPAQKKKVVLKLPTALEFFGYAYFYPSFLAGPTVEYSEYQNYITGKQFQDEYCNGRIPNTFFPTLRRFFHTVCCIAVMVGAGMFISPALMISREFLTLSTSQRMLLVLLAPTICRFKYYFGWNLAETAFVACGISYNGFGLEWQEADKADDDTKALKGTPGLRWERYANVRIEKVELGSNIRDVTVYWNYRTGEFLRSYVYERVPKVTAKGLKGAVLNVLMSPTLDVFLVSALWHGFYPGYYMFFVYLSVEVTTAREARRMFRWRFLKSPALKKFYDFLTFLVTSLFTGYGGVAFLLMSWENIVWWYSSLYWYGHIGLVASFLLLKVLAIIAPPPRTARPIKTEETKTEAVKTQ